ncbi:MAG: hypothetical protein IT369_15805 [Candidatus Latescibacteria bacterium]|nr:hypothetical protein [Candidatus Latescibacterota bacterium]
MTKGELCPFDNPFNSDLPAGPWQAVEQASTGFFLILDRDGRSVARVDRGWALDRQTAEFIAHARLDLGALVQEVLSCWERIAGLEEEVAALLGKLAQGAWPDEPGGCQERAR